MHLIFSKLSASSLLSEREIPQGKFNLVLVQQICSCPFPESPPCQSALSPLRAISNTQDVCLSTGSPLPPLSPPFSRPQMST